MLLNRVCSSLEEEQQVVDDAGQGTSESEGEPSCPPPQKIKSKDFFEDYLTRKEAREEQKVREQEEEDETYHFVMSLAPAMRRLPSEQQSWLKIQIQEMVHEVEFSFPSTSAYTVLYVYFFNIVLSVILILCPHKSSVCPCLVTHFNKKIIIKTLVFFHWL